MRSGSLSRALLATGIAIGVLPIVGADPAYACSCVQTDEQRRYDQATHVFKGTVLAAQGTATSADEVSTEPVVYTFDVISTYKGRVTDPQKVSTAGNSAACGVELDGDGPFLVFAQADGSELTMNLCGGTRPIGENDEPTFGRTPTAPAAPPGEAPAGPPAEAPDAEPVDQPGLSSTLIDKLAGLAGQISPPGR